ncbi:hypothetical protein DEA8626_02429 [Defluviimonas aquaemixtae]|uniref:Uncharacterized protein n=1 Tax=Albidovulum aquaemixtae TaxID=1542388 RepID=A0A2R8BIX8_9RHOB|nr:hypothetical protein DEA8626_02429 [Defluviimonas aquaemixtae]
MRLALPVLPAAAPSAPAGVTVAHSLATSIAEIGVTVSQ